VTYVSWEQPPARPETEVTDRTHGQHFLPATTVAMPWKECVRTSSWEFRDMTHDHLDRRGLLQPNEIWKEADSTYVNSARRWRRASSCSAFSASACVVFLTISRSIRCDDNCRARLQAQVASRRQLDSSLSGNKSDRTVPPNRLGGVQSLVAAPLRAICCLCLCGLVSLRDVSLRLLRCRSTALEGRLIGGDRCPTCCVCLRP